MSARVELSVVAPCFNEAGNLPELVERLRHVFERRALRGEIVLVDDGSHDDTGAVIERLAAERPELVKPVRHPRNLGIVPAWRSGLAAASGSHVCLIDADLQNLPEDVWRLYREAQFSNADLTQGFRSSVGRLRDSRYVLSKGLNFLLNLLFGMRLRDNKSGFVLARRETLEHVLRPRYRYRYFQTFIAVSAFAKGYTIREVETLFESRLLGRSFMARFPLKVITASFVDLAKGFVEFRLLRRPETLLEGFLGEHPAEPREPRLPLWRKLLLDFYFLSMPLHAWMLTPRTRLYYQELMQSQWLDAAELRALQERKLRRLVQHAYRHVGYYRQRLQEAGIEPDAIRTLEDLRRLPLLEKAHVRENLYFDLLSDNHDKRRILKVATSGSTGEPFVCYADQHQLELRFAATLRGLSWTGYRFGDRQARLWHQTIGMTWQQALRERLDALLARRLFIPAFEMTDASIRRFVRRLQRFRPVLLDGYAESFNYLATHLKRAAIPGLRPLGIVSSAQALPDDSRRRIEEAFETRVFDKYGSREFSGIAYECAAHAGHHVVAESYVVEVLRDGAPAAPGELGEVVITDLNNFCLPFIRYRIGDVAVAMDPQAPCPCGRGLPRLGRIEGRVQSIILGADGRILPASLFPHVFKDYDYLVRQFQVIQEEALRLRLKIVPGPRYDAAVFKREVLSVLRRFLGEAMAIEVELVDAIPMVRTGKRQVTVSRLNLDFQALDHGEG